MSILELKNISYTYRGRYQTVRAVNDVSMSFEQGTVYAILGKSGSGKTTLLSLLAGLALPTEGEVLFEGKPTDQLDLDRYRREDVAVIYQGYNLFPLLTVEENVMYPMQLVGIPTKDARSHAARLLKSVGLRTEQFRRYPSMLSGGEQQRVAIARSLAMQPRLILADEPTGNLDVENGNNVVALLKQLAADLNCCVIIVTHDATLAQQTDVVCRMSDGRLFVETVYENAE